MNEIPEYKGTSSSGKRSNNKVGNEDKSRTALYTTFPLNIKRIFSKTKNSPKHTQFYGTIHSEENVVTFDISMYDTISMQEIEGLQTLCRMGRDSEQN